MYSMVLMAALTTGPTTPDCWLTRHGCCGGTASYGCCGGYGYGGCHGGCWGGSCYGSYSYGCWGSYSYGCYGSPYGGCRGYSCVGSGCVGYYGGSYGGVTITGYGSPVPLQGPPQGELVPLPKKDGSESLAPNRARLIVDLPSDATLYIDDHKMTTNTSHKVFNTPALETGETYYYMVRAEVMKDGAPVSATKRVIVKPGEEIVANFKDMAAPTITTAKLP
jgi:uncharacterized protein (TIGR03000 family)